LLPQVRVHAAIGVLVEPPTVTRIEFDRREPPPAMRRASADGAALCSNVFEIEAEIASALEVLSPTTVRVYPTDFDIVTRLKTTIYMPKGSPDKLRAHEEGHRAIGEHYYGSAESAAREAATSLVGRAFEASGDDRAAAEQAAGDSVVAALRDAFMLATQARSAAANARYDVLTDHGRSFAITEAAAIAAAVADDSQNTHTQRQNDK
jgi:hypothetical protein